MLDVRESDLVAARVPPGPAWPALLERVWDAGAALLPLDVRASRAELDAILARAQPTVVVDAGALSTVALDELEAVRRDGEPVLGKHTAARRLEGEPVLGKHTAARRIEGEPVLGKHVAVRRLEGEPVAPGVGLVVATSGSAGEPRLAELGRDAIDAAVRAGLERLGATADDPWLSCLPLAHMGGLLVVLRARAAGADLRFAARLVPGARLASVVPTQLVRALDERVDLSGFRHILAGGAALDPARASRAPVVTTYGLTESCGGVVYDGVPLRGVEVRIARDDEIQLAGPTLMRGYRGDEAATATAFTPDGWLRTRDAGALEGGRLVVRGRLDDAIVTGGEKVWPDEVERVLCLHPGVAEVAVAGEPDPEWGRRVVAYVVPRDASPPTLADLRAFAADRMARHKAPRALVLVGEIPKTRSGKPARSRLGRA